MALLLISFIIIIVTQQSIMRLINSRGLKTDQIANTFHISAISGNWGEVQLRRVVELAGMIPHTEFAMQKETAEGRPDMTVHLPNNCTIYVDSKVPISAYLKSIDEPDNKKFLKENAKAVKTYIYNLSRKEYWKSGKGVSFTVMFIASEIVWLAALHQDETLMEYAAENNVIVSTPMTLIALLKVIASAWETHAINKEHQKIFNLLKTIKVLGSNMQEDCSTSIAQCNKLTQNLKSLQETITKVTEKTL